MKPCEADTVYKNDVIQRLGPSVPVVPLMNEESSPRTYPPSTPLQAGSSQTRAGARERAEGTGGRVHRRPGAPAVCLWTRCPQTCSSSDIRKAGALWGTCLRAGGAPTYLQGLCDRSGPAAIENRAGPSRRDPGHLPEASILFFFLQADGFQETCTSFNVSGLLLIWALTPCDGHRLLGALQKRC